MEAQATLTESVLILLARDLLTVREDSDCANHVERRSPKIELPNARHLPAPFPGRSRLSAVFITTTCRRRGRR